MVESQAMKSTSLSSRLPKIDIKKFKSWLKKQDWPRIWRFVRIGVAAFVFFIAGLFAWYSKDLPTPGTIRDRQAAESTRIFDRTGKSLYEIHGDKDRTILSSDEIPDIVKQATLAAEDRYFYDHFGIDFRGLLRAAFLDVFQGQRVGGSTITQQYVKNALLTNHKTLDRKIKELILSLEVEAMFSKEEILTMYLNEVPYGSSYYGVQAASKAFFAKDAKDLTLPEAAMLGAIVQRPTRYSPYGTHTDELKGRRDFVLDTMADLGNITKEQAEEAKATEIAVVEQRDSIEAPHFVFYIREQLVEQFGEEMVEQGGLKVTTTLDLDMQHKAEEAIAKGMDRVRARGGSNAALVSVNPDNGEIVAMVGSADYFDKENDGNVNVTLSQRQPGSSFKPIVYAAGFKEQYSPASTLWDVSTDFGNYRPNNYDGSFRGPVSVRFALANSLNIPAVKMLGLVGINKAIDFAHELGITTLNDRDRYGLALVLGGGEVRPLDMATAFSVFANGGTYRPPVSILKVERSDGEILFEQQSGKGEKQVLDPAVAYQITDVLSDNAARSAVFGPRSSLYFPNRQVAAKTGTTQEFHDAWTVGYVPELATAVWVGNNDNTGMRNADGSVVAAPIFNTFINSTVGGASDRKFVRPDNLRSVTVDKLSGKLPTDSSPETVTDLFAPWQIPKEKDDIHVKVKVNKLNGKLASALTPASLTEERTYTVLRSERPESPSWNQPVIDWAQSHGIQLGTPPTETDDMYNESNLPQVNITDPSDGQTVTGTFSVTATASAAFGLRSVDLTIDGIGYGFDTTAPYQFTVAASDLGPGEHTVNMTTYDVNGASQTDTITVRIDADAKAPGNVQNVSATPQSKAVRLGWRNPDDSDLERVRIYVSTINGQLGTLYPTEVTVTPDSTSAFSVTGLASGIPYYFTLRPVDSSGNENKSTSQTTSVALP